ncbi:MAG: DUF4212 domain-containing protein [Planctomycetes bacterium]|nr:DUF4212 domain-containing protein [Planctomycetota bacterium]
MTFRKKNDQAYWQANLRLLAGLLSIWALSSFGMSILFRAELDQLRVFQSGFPLGFWFAQQGSTLVFVILVFVYARRMNHLDDEFIQQREQERNSDQEIGDPA